MAEEKGMGEIISEGYQDLVRTHGDEVLIHTATCMEWKLEHDNCIGCVSELGCGKTVCMMGVSMTPIMYEPRSFADYEAMQSSIQEKLDRILNAKTSEEVKNVNW